MRRVTAKEHQPAAGIQPVSCTKDGGRPTHGTARTWSWGFVSQGFTSATNFILTIAVLRSSSALEFGSYSLAYGGALLVLAFIRALNCTPMLLSDGIAKYSRGALARSATIALLFVPAGIVGLVASDFPGSSAFFVLIMAVPVWVVQETQRYCAFSRGEPKQAAAIDLVWLVLLVPVLFFAGPPWLTVLWWAVAGLASILVGLRTTFMRPRAGDSRSYRYHANRWMRSMAVEALASTALIQLNPYVISIVLGVAAYGSFRAAEAVLGPVTLLLAASSPLAIRQFKVIRDTNRDKLARTIFLVSGLIAGLGLLYLGLVSLVPAQLLATLFGPVLYAASPIILLVGARICILAGYVTMLNGVRVTAPPRSVALVRTMAACLDVLGTAAGGLLAGLQGAAGGGAVVALLSLLMILIWTSTNAVRSTVESGTGVVGSGAGMS